MNNRRNLIWFCAAPLVALGCLLVMLLGSDGTIVGGYILGTALGHTTLAAAWTAFGPLRLVWRLPLSLLWLVSVIVAIACNVALNHGPVALIAIIACCLFGQFLLLQFPLWGLAIWYRLRLRHHENISQAPDPKELQFGIGELMIFTTIVAVLLGLGRLAIGIAPTLVVGLGQPTLVFIFLGLAAIVTTLPLVLAALLPRFAIPAVILVIVFIGLATASEVPLLDKFSGGGVADPLIFTYLNSFTAAWILAVVFIVRLSGYRLSRGQR